MKKAILSLGLILGLGVLVSCGCENLVAPDDKENFYDITTTVTHTVFTNVKGYSNFTTLIPTLISNYERVDFVGGEFNTNFFVRLSEALAFSNVVSNFLNTLVLTNINAAITVMSNTNGLLSNVELTITNFITNVAVSNIVVMDVFETNISVTKTNTQIQNTDDLSNANLSSFNLSSLDLRGYNLIGANLSNANLSNALFSNANLNNANLSNALFIFFEKSFNSSDTNIGRVFDHQEIAVDDKFVYIVFNDNESDVQLFDKSTGAYVTNFGSSNSPINEQFKSPQGIAVDDSFIYVADGHSSLNLGRREMLVFDKNTRDHVTNFGSSGSGNGQFQRPSEIAVDDSFIYVVDIGSGRDDVQVFDKNTRAYVTNFGNDAAKLNTDNGQFQLPVGIAVDDGFIYVTDVDRDDVQVFDKNTRAYVYKFGSSGTNNNGQFSSPVSIVVDDSYIYVADSDRDDVQVFDKTSGAYITEFKNRGTNNGQFENPVSIAIDDKFIYILAPAGVQNDDMYILSSSLKGARFD